MQVYITKNNRQFGPFEEAKVLEMLKNGQLSPNDLAIHHGAKEWQKLGSYFPNSTAASATTQTAPKKSWKGLWLGCGGIFLIVLLVAGVLVFLACRNLNPADSKEELPDKVGALKLDTRYPPKGNVRGPETTSTNFSIISSRV
jgi:hypothetical protein